MTLKTLFIATTLGLATQLAYAGPNLLSNGSFESGLTGWTQTGSPVVTSPTTYPIVAITYGSASPYPTGAFGEAVPSPTDVSLSSDPVGTHGAYFVDDHAVNQGLTQVVFLAAGNYRIGFDAYAPTNGYANPSDARFSAQIAGISLANYLVSSTSAANWVSFSGLATVAVSGFYSASFVFNTPGTGPAKDVVIDRAYITATNEPGGPVIGVPEPETAALMGIALLALGASRRKPKR